MLTLLAPRRASAPRAWLSLLALATLSCALLLADDFLQQLFTANNHAELEAGYVAVLWLFSLGLWPVSYTHLRAHET